MTFIKSSRESEWVSHKPTNRCYRIQSKLVAINYRLARRKDSSSRRRWKLSIPRPSIESLILTSAASKIISHKSWVWAGRDDDEVVQIFFTTPLTIHQYTNQGEYAPLCRLISYFSSSWFIYLFKIRLMMIPTFRSHFTNSSRALLWVWRDIFADILTTRKALSGRQLSQFFLYSTRRYFDPENVTHVLANCCVRSERGATVESAGILLTDWLNVEAYQFAPHWRI